MRPGFVAVLAGALLASCGGGAGDPTSVPGSLVVLASSPSYRPEAQPRDPCEATDGYSDINASTVVVLRDDGGEIVDRADLGGGHLEIDNGNTRTCRFRFYLELPAGDDLAEEFTVEVGRRGEVLFTRQELLGPGAQLELHS